MFLKEIKKRISYDTYSPPFYWAKMAECKSEKKKSIKVYRNIIIFNVIKNNICTLATLAF